MLPSVVVKSDVRWVCEDVRGASVLEGHVYGGSKLKITFYDGRPMIVSKIDFAVCRVTGAFSVMTLVNLGREKHSIESRSSQNNLGPWFDKAKIPGLVNVEDSFPIPVLLFPFDRPYGMLIIYNTLGASRSLSSGQMSRPASKTNFSQTISHMRAQLLISTARPCSTPYHRACC